MKFFKIALLFIPVLLIAGCTPAPVSKCLQSGDDAQKYSCISDLALESGKIDYCSYIDTPLGSSANGNYSCIDEVATKLADEKICKKLKNNKLELEQCYESTAIKKGDEKICKLFKEESEQDNCLGVLAVHRNEPKFCEMIKNSGKRANCQSSLPGNTESDCLKMPTDTAKDDCFSSLAIRQKDIKNCLKISKDSSRDSCIKWMAVEKQDAKICMGMKDEKLCEGIEDEKVCEETGYNNQKTSCYVYVALKVKKDDACSLIEGVGYRDTCYYFVASGLRSEAVCQKISKEQKRNDCLKLFK